MTKFKTGKTYYATSLCDSNCVFEFKVLSRTEKFVTLGLTDGEIKRKVYRACNGGDEAVEMCYPLGMYSMCPVITAKNELSL